MKKDERSYQEKLNFMLNRLDDNIKKASVVYVAPHKRMDYDSLAASAAMCEICRKYNKRAFIVSDDNTFHMPTNLKTMYDRLEADYPFITSSILDKIRKDNLTDEEINDIINNNYNVVSAALKIIYFEKGIGFFLPYLEQREMDNVTRPDRSLEEIISRLATNHELVKVVLKDIFKGYKQEEELFIAIDFNKNYLVSEELEKMLPTFAKIVVIDHHKTDNHTITTKDILTDESVSSASEILFNILETLDVKIKSYLATCLLTGIYLDTNIFSLKDEPNTHIVCAQLQRLGADSNYAKKMIKSENFEKSIIQEEMISLLKKMLLFLIIVLQLH